MLAGAQIAPTSSDAVGCTFTSECYEFKIHGKPFKFHDTAGLGECAEGKVSAPQAIENLFRLIRELEGGISLLVYVVRGPRLRDAARKNYLMFYEIFCEEQVPIVVVVTGLEEEKDRQAWWGRNESHFLKQRIVFGAAACITATPGKRGVYEEEYEESKKSVQDVVLRWCAQEPWRPVTVISWFSKVCKVGIRLDHVIIAKIHLSPAATTKIAVFEIPFARISS